jgi:hypothetical protein
VSEQLDRYNLAARLEKFGDYLMTKCEKGEAIENRIDVCNQISAVCRIEMTLKALRMEDRRADPDAATVRKYATEFATRRAAGAGSAAEAASDSFIAEATDPFADPAEE